MRTKKDLGNALEEKVLRNLQVFDPQAYRTPNSGAVYGEDIHAKYFLVQCKKRNHKNFTIDPKDFEKLKGTAYRRARMAVFASENEKGEVVISMPLDDWLEITQGYYKARKVKP